MVAELKATMHEDDALIEKVRMSGFHGTHPYQVPRAQGINTLIVDGVNIGQCVSTTMKNAEFRDYNAALLADAAVEPSARLER